MAASDLFKKPNVQGLEPASRIQLKPSKSCSSLFTKSLVIILVLVVIPLFPSQAPDFINQSILSKFWELLHLLFIGIAVSYGLFSRRNAKMDIEDHSGPDTSHPYFSGISNVSSFFEDGLENMCISDEKKMMHILNPQYLYSKSIFRGCSVTDEGKKPRSFTFGNGSEDISEDDRENESDIWNPHYYQGESLVVFTDGNYTLEEDKPLGLPTRSLRSRIPGAEKPQFANSHVSSSSLKSSLNSDSEDRVEKIRGIAPTNLHNKFEEVIGPSIIPWKSRSGRMEMGEVGNSEPPGHSRPHSVGECEFKQFTSRSFRQSLSSSGSSKSLGSRMTIKSSSASPELPNLKTENLELKKDLKIGCDSISHSRVANGDNGLSFTNIEARGFSIGSSLELDMQKNSEDDFKDYNRGADQHPLGRGKPSSNPVSPDAKPSNLSKILSRAKSVRTFRSGRYVNDKMKRTENYSNQIADEVGAVDDQFGAPILVNTQITEHEDPPVNIQKQNSDEIHSGMSSIFPEYHDKEKQHVVDSVLASKEEDSDSQCETKSDEESSDENENMSAEVDDEDLAGSEVDRKADEFIAKFREQIRLQKIASIRKNGFC